MFDRQKPDVLSEQVLELAKAAGADAAEVYQALTDTNPVFFDANRVKRIERSQTEAIALRLWRGGRPGLAVAHGPVDPQALVERAAAISQMTLPEAVELASPKPVSYSDVGHAVSIPTLTQWGKEAIAHVRDCYPDVLCYAEWTCEAETTRLLNSKGLDYRYTDTTLSSYLSAERIRDGDFLNVSDGQTRRDLLSPTQLAGQILQRLHWARDSAPTLQGRLPVLFTSKAADMLWGTVQLALDGRRVLERSSPWSDLVGEQVLSHHLTLSQQPQAGPFSCPFDDEGMPTRQITFIDRGELQLFYTDRTVGNRLGSGTTGNGFRPDLGSYPRPGMFNFLVEPGDRSLAALIKQLDRGIVVDQMLGEDSSISGNFSINVDLGYRVENGQIIGRLKNTMVSGNVYRALKQVEVGDDAQWNGPCYTPSVVLGDLSVVSR
ncbi:MAG: TldD/PmbA family protein [Cyanobacteria bacterium P01_A01_bin.135]